MAYEVFISYSHRDQALRNELDKHLANLKRQNIIASWSDGNISPGTEWEPQIMEHLKRAQIILLLVSADFMASDFCYSIEMTQAIARHDANQARVIPILLRPTAWKGAPFAKLQALPSDNKAVTSWTNQDEAFVNIAEGIQRVVEELAATTPVGVAQVSTWNVPYTRNALFTGREDVLTRLYEALRADKTTASPQPQAISGLGGIGKTQTAVEYAYRHQDDYDSVLWVKAESREALISDFVVIAHLLNLPVQQEQEQHRVIEAVKRWFQEHSDWLLIFDNADDLTILRDFLPAGGKGHILLTTRTQAMGRIAQRIELEQMEPDEGALFLLHRATLLDPGAPLGAASMSDREAARKISIAMDGLPLALDQAGAFIEETQSSLSDYLQFYHTRQDELLRRRGRLVTDHPDPVATTWSLSFEKLQQANPAAADLLRLCAFLDPNMIQEEIISQGASELGSVLQPVANDPIKLNEAIGALLSYSLVHRNPDHTLTIHRLVQAVLKHGMNKSTQRRWAERAVRAVNLAFPEVEYENWLRCQQFIPHVLACTALIEQWDLALPEAAQLLDDTGYYLTESAQYEQAGPLLQRALVFNERVLGPEHPDTATSFNNLAMLYHAQRKYEQAEPLHQRALAVRESVLGPEHPETAASLNNLAMLYHAQRKYEQAESLLQRALAVRESVLGPEHLETTKSLNNLAVLYRSQGKYEQAEPLYQRALAIRESLLGPEHYYTARSLGNLASLFYAQGKYEQAEPLLQRALAIYERVLGPEHPEAAIILNNLAGLYYAQGKYEQAEPLYQQALAIWERVLGPEHPEAATILNNLAELYHAQGKYEQAESLLQRVRAIRERGQKP